MKQLFLLIGATAIAACSRDINLDNYREQEGEKTLTINAIVTPDSIITASATRTYFYTDVHKESIAEKNLDMELWINGVFKENMRYNPNKHLYESTTYPKQGDKINLRTLFAGKTVEATDTVPNCVKIEQVKIDRQGPVYLWTGNDYIFTYQITFTDNANEENYYYVQVEADAFEVVKGQPDYEEEFVFQQLAKQVNATVPGWKPSTYLGLPFSDRGINGQHYTLTIRELMQCHNGYDGPIYPTRMNRKVKLFAISKSYYNYLVSIISNETDDGIHGGLIDIGITEPIHYYNNIDGGVGILGSYVLDEKRIDVFKAVGDFSH